MPIEIYIILDLVAVVAVIYYLNVISTRYWTNRAKKMRRN